MWEWKLWPGQCPASFSSSGSGINVWNNQTKRWFGFMVPYLKNYFMFGDDISIMVYLPGICSSKALWVIFPRPKVSSSALQLYLYGSVCPLYARGMWPTAWDSHSRWTGVSWGSLCLQLFTSVSLVSCSTVIAHQPRPGARNLDIFQRWQPSPEPDREEDMSNITTHVF